jgi:capsular polysaccharide transport system permease protein
MAFPPRDRTQAWFLRGLKTQANVIGALLMRELHTRYGRDNIGYLWIIGEPLILATSVGLLHLTNSTLYGTDIQPVPFALIGYCTYVVFRNTYNRAEGTLESNMPLLYHRMVTVFDMLLARSLLEGAGVGLAMFILLGISSMLGLATLPFRPMWLILAVLLITWFGFAMSLIIVSGTHHQKFLARLVHPSSYVLMPLSGAFYILHWLPQPYQTWMSWFPMTLIFEMARYGEFEGASDEFINVTYVVCWCGALTIAGMLGTRIVRRHVHLN